MATIKSVLHVLCKDLIEQETALAICTSGIDQKYEFWLDVHTQLVYNCSSIQFDQYPSIARCHVLCMATSHRCGGIWANIVLEELTRRATVNAHLDAYVMGSQLGLFQAGNWLQERQALIGQNFLSGVARYCIMLFGKRCRVVNSSDTAEISKAHQELDRAVKDYLRPQNRTLAEQLKPEIHKMLVELQPGTFVEDEFDSPRGCGAHHWLLDALLHGSLNIPHRNRSELIRAALSIST